MRRTVNVHLVIFSAAVVFANALVTSELQGNQEQFSEIERRDPVLAALLKSEQRLLHRHQRAGGLLQVSAAAKDSVSKSQRKSTKATSDAVAHKKTPQADLPLVPQVAGHQQMQQAAIRQPLTAPSHSSASAEGKTAPKKPVTSLSVKSAQATSARSVLSKFMTWGILSRIGNMKSPVLTPSRKQWLWSVATKAFLAVSVWAVLMMTLGFYYHHEKEHPPKLDPEGVHVSLHDREPFDRQRWRFGLFEYAEVKSLFLFSFFCAPIRWADTMRMAGFMNFFTALSIVVGLTVLGTLTLGLGFLVLIAVCVHFRQRMRQKFDIRSRSCGSSTHTTDVLSYMFFPWFCIVQEARQIEEAYLARHASIRHEYTMRRAPLRLAAMKVPP